MQIMYEYDIATIYISYLTNMLAFVDFRLSDELVMNQKVLVYTNIFAGCNQIIYRDEHRSLSRLHMQLCIQPGNVM